MKKIIFIVITFLLTVSVQAQSNVEKRAKRISETVSSASQNIRANQYNKQ